MPLIGIGSIRLAGIGSIVLVICAIREIGLIIGIFVHIESSV